MIRVGLSIALAAVTVFAAAVLPTHVYIAGDTNGDQHVNVLDLQRIIAQVLAREVYDARADVNRDGRVDILDFQKVLDLARDKAHSQQPTPATSDAVPILRTQAPMPIALTVTTQFFTPGKRVTTAALRARSVPKRPSCAKRERYTLRLMPHAPPVQA